jgi:hypothetical protein
MAEHSAVNRRVVGSSPTSGAITNQQLSLIKHSQELWKYANGGRFHRQPVSKRMLSHSNPAQLSLS